MNAADILKYGQLTALQSIDGFPETAWETAGRLWLLVGQGHHRPSRFLRRVLVDILTTFTADSATPMLNTYLELGGQFNDSEVDKRKGKSIQDVLAEFNDAHSQVMSLIVSIPAETLRQNGTLPWYGMDYCLDDVLVYMYYGHKREHSAQIAAFRDTLERSA